MLQQTALGGSAEHQDAICAENHHENPVESTLNLELGFSSVLFGSHKLGAAQSLLKCPPSQLQDFHRLVTRCENICDFNLQEVLGLGHLCGLST